jgi:hypothetical protein
MKRYYWLFSACWALSLPAASITGAKVGGPPVKQPPYTVSLTPGTVQHISASDLYSNGFYGDLNLLRGEYNNSTEWLFSSAGTDAPGTFNILQYDPWIAQNYGGANFSVLYDDGDLTSHTNYNWIQIAHFHNWGSAGSGDKVDTPFSDSPFYGSYTPKRLPDLKTSDFPSGIGTGDIWLNKTDYPAQKIQSPAGGGKVPAGDLIFSDQPYCPLSCSDKDGTAYAYFDLFLATFTWNGKVGSREGGNVSIMDGMRWGVEITKEPATPSDPGKIPEPSTWLMIGTGTILLLLGRRRNASECLRCGAALKREFTRLWERYDLIHDRAALINRLVVDIVAVVQHTAGSRCHHTVRGNGGDNRTHHGGLDNRPRPGRKCSERDSGSSGSRYGAPPRPTSSIDHYNTWAERVPVVP